MVGLIKKLGGAVSYPGSSSMTMKSALIISSMLIISIMWASSSALAAGSKDVGVSSFNMRRWTNSNVVQKDDGAAADGGKRVLQEGNLSLEFQDQDPEFIIGGTELDESVWDTSRRYLVALAEAETVVQPSGSPSPHSCTASLISRRVVLLAAHCVDVNGDFNAEDSVIKLNMYSYDVQNKVVTIPLCNIEGGGGDGDCTDLAYAIRHENYDDDSFDNDFALIFLPDIPEVNTGIVADIDPVKLNSDANVPEDGEELEVFGWGRTGFDGEDPTNQPKVPNTVNLQYVPAAQCEEAWGEGKISDSMLCAIADGKAVGTGDSGGPIITLGDAGESVQVGVTSFGKEGRPDGFARVSEGFEWIKTTVCREIPDDSVFCAATLTPTSAPTRSTSAPTTATKAAKKGGAPAAKSTKSPVMKANKSKASK